jgi:hypothetical protein
MKNFWKSSVAVVVQKKIGGNSSGRFFLVLDLRDEMEVRFVRSLSDQSALF